MMDWRAWIRSAVLSLGGGRMMQGKHPDVFALKSSGVEAFLYADVGTELNGSTLTTLSVLARLGTDPWAEAARWAALPRAVATDELARIIAQMPLVPSALDAARETAARLVQLLPVGNERVPQSAEGRSKASQRQFPPVTILYCILAVGMALDMLASSSHSHEEALTPLSRAVSASDLAALPASTTASVYRSD